MGGGVCGACACPHEAPCACGEKAGCALQKCHTCGEGTPHHLAARGGCCSFAGTKHSATVFHCCREACAARARATRYSGAGLVECSACGATLCALHAHCRTGLMCKLCANPNRRLNRDRYGRRLYRDRAGRRLTPR